MPDEPTVTATDHGPRRPVVRRARLVVAQLASFRPSWAWIRSVIRSFATSFLALTFSLWLLPGTQVTRGAESVAFLAVLVLAIGALLRPLLTRLTVLTGVVGLLLTGVLAQALVLWLALEVVPTVEHFSVSEVVLASWGAAVAAAAVNWLFDASSDEAFLGQLLGRAVRSTRHAGADGPGLLVVQLDGVSEPLLRQAITSGAMPTVSRWIRSGSHQLRGWHTGLPATTPAGQAALLHGDDSVIPAFRWFDKEQGRLVATSRPADAAQIEKTISTGRGLLADGGASVSNLFSGDASTRILTLSDARLPGSDRGSASFAALRFGFLRSITLFVGQMITEWHQGRRQRIRNVVPRVRRGGAFVVLRGLTTVVLRDLNVAVVADQLTRGTPVVFVDFVDYDEVAHHAGPTRPEALRTLENLDRVLNFLDQLAGEVGRRYEIAVLSDHGQAQGSTFLQLTGSTLEEVVQRLAARPVDSEENPDETWIPASLLLAGASGSGRIVTRAAARSLNRGPEHASEQPAKRSKGAQHTSTTPAEAPARLQVAVSGSLAHVYRTDLPGRMTRERLDELHPGLVSGLAEHPQLGLVMTRRADGRLAVDGNHGWRLIATDGGAPRIVAGAGEDPLASYGPTAMSDLAALDRKQHVGDLVLLGRHDTALGEVVAFEELVGSHGGLGGWQTRAMLVHPSAWNVTAEPLTGPRVHQAMIDRLTDLGLRREEP